MLLGPGYQVEELIPPILEIIRKIIPIKQITFDRGFGKNALIYQLEKLKLKYLIFCARNSVTGPILDEVFPGEIKTKIRDLKFSSWGETYRFKSKFVFIKQFRFNESEEAYNWIFATNMAFDSIRHIVASYRNRWGIETIFRVIKQEFRIKTTSKHQSVRLFCLCFSMIFYNIWQIAKYFINIRIKAKSFYQTIRFGFKTKYNLTYKYEKEILEYFNLV